MNSNLNSFNILGYWICAGEPREIASSMLSEAEHGRGQVLACLNPHSYAVALNDPHFSAALQRSEWLIPDGAGVVFAGRCLGKRFHRITGFDMFEAVNRELDARGGKRIFLLGSTVETLTKVRGDLVDAYRGLEGVDTYSPPFVPAFSDDEVARIAGAITQSRPSVVWVSLTAPKQEKLIAQLIPLVPPTVFGAVGAVFDFQAGNVKRSPEVFRRLGLEWLPRLVQEPRRLWRRTFVSAPIFLFHVLRERARNGRK